MWLYDSSYLLFVIPGLVLAFAAQWYVSVTFRRFGKVPLSTGLSGAEVATALLRDAGVRDVAVEETSGFLSDHYDPSAKVLRLSPAVYRGRSVSSAGVAAHESGHAVQHARKYGLMPVRQALVLPARLGSQLGFWVILIGLALHALELAWIGVALFGCILLFELVTLPVEINASSRARALLLAGGLAGPADEEGVRKVLRAAAFTYVAAAAMSLLDVMRWLRVLRL